MTKPTNNTYPLPASKRLLVREQDIEDEFIEKLRSLKYTYRDDIHDRAALERNFRQKFETLNRVRLTDGEFQRLLDELINPDVFTAARVLREKNGFDSKFLNTLYVDKNLKHHGLIQAFSRTNRILNATKPHGQVLDFRGQQDAVDAAVALFSGVDNGDKAREIWLVDPAETVVEKLKDALGKLDDYMQSQGLEANPESVPALRGDEARAAFIERFREVQRVKTQLDQYTDLAPATAGEIDQLLPKDQLNAFRGVYLETAQRLRAERDKPGITPDPAVDQLDFEFVLFASAHIDYDYIMALLARFSQTTPSKETMNRKQLIGLIQADAKFMDERDIITDYVRTLEAGQGLDEEAIRAGYVRFKKERHAAELAAVAHAHDITVGRLESFVETILKRMVFDGERLTELMEPLDLGWKARRDAELALVADLVPLLKRRAAGRDISGLSAYEQ